MQETERNIETNPNIPKTKQEGWFIILFQSLNNPVWLSMVSSRLGGVSDENVAA